MRLLLCSLVLVVQSSFAETRDLILIAGQSNAVGFDAYPSELPADPKDKEVLFWWRSGDPPPDEHDSTSARQWTFLQPQSLGNPIPREQEALLHLSRQYGNFKKTEGGFGPEMGLTRSLRKLKPTPLAIVKVAFSGTAMRTDWNPADPGSGGACYRALIAETKEAIAAAKAMDVTLKLRALIWVQGESDSTANDAPNYQIALGEFLSALRADLAAPQLPALLSINPHFGNDKNPFVPTVIAAQQAIAAQDPRCVYVDNSTAETLLPSQTHFSAAGTITIGNNFANALLKLESTISAQSPTP